MHAELRTVSSSRMVKAIFYFSLLYQLYKYLEEATDSDTYWVGGFVSSRSSWKMHTVEKFMHKFQNCCIKINYSNSIFPPTLGSPTAWSSFCSWHLCLQVAISLFIDLFFLMPEGTCAHEREGRGKRERWSTSARVWWNRHPPSSSSPSCQAPECVCRHLACFSRHQGQDLTPGRTWHPPHGAYSLGHRASPGLFCIVGAMEIFVLYFAGFAEAYW